MPHRLKWGQHEVISSWASAHSTGLAHRCPSHLNVGKDRH